MNWSIVISDSTTTFRQNGDVKAKNTPEANLAGFKNKRSGPNKAHSLRGNEQQLAYSQKA